MQNLPDLELLRNYPWVPWGEPWIVKQQRAVVESRYGCRMCVAQYGLKGSNFDNLYADEESWREHMHAFHPEVPLRG